MAIYLVCVACLCPPPNFGPDTGRYLHFLSVDFEYASSPIDVCVMSPFEGLGGQVEPHGVWLNPSLLLPHLLTPKDPRTAGFLVVMISMAAATFLLGRAMGLPHWLALIGAQVVSIFSFPPMWWWSYPITRLNVFTYMYVWGDAMPAALGTLLLTIYCYVGKLSRNGNIACIVLMPLLLVYSILCDPLYTAMFFLTIGFFLAGVLFGSGSRQVFFWRLGGGAACVAVSLLLNLHGFVRGLFGYAARSIFPNELYVEVQQWDYYAALIFQGGLATVVMVLLILSCIVACVFGNSQMRGFAASVLVFVGFISSATLIFVYSGMRWHLPMPYYVELPAHPTYVVAGLLGAWLSWGKLRTWLHGKVSTGRWPPILHALKVAVGVGSVLAIPSWAMFSVRAIQATPATACPGGLVPPRKADRSIDAVQGSIAARAMSASEGASDLKGIVKFLELELAIGEDGRFRGSVANLIGVPGGPLMDRLGVPEEAPFEKRHIEFLDNYLPTFDPHLSISGLWDLRIPTLEDNNHMVTPPFHFLTTRTLSRSQDYHSRNWALLTLARPSLMAALGTRFLLTDRMQSRPRLSLRAQQVNGDGITAYAYEIQGPNLGNYSPLRSVVANDASQMISLMKDEQFDFQDAVIVETPITGPLTRAHQAEMHYENGGVRVRATSDGRSLLVLPVQFSNSLRLVETKLNSRSVPIEFRRVNLVETGLLFDGQIEVKFAHVFGPFRGVAGRLRDIDDCRRLGIRETGEIPYPPNFQPLGPNGWKIQRGLMPATDQAEGVEAFLKSGGENWKSLLRDGRLVQDGEFWIWPVADRVVQNRDSNFAPFQIHWRLQPGKNAPAAGLGYAFEVQGRIITGQLPPCGPARDGIFNCILNAQNISGEGVVPFFLIAAGSTPQRCSNVLLLSVKLHSPGPPPATR